MKIKISFFTFICALFLSNHLYSQIDNIGPMLAGSVGNDDAQKLLEAYFKPYGNAFGANLNGAWYNTAKTHKLGGFDLTFSITTSFVPKADKEFDASQLGLSSGAVVDGTNKMSPTIAGEKTTGARINYPAFGSNFGFNLPKGTGWGVIPSPMIQLGIGLVKETDLTFRYVPSINIGEYGKIGLWGIGIKHSLKQWIPGIKELPFFHLSVFMGYTQLKSSADISFKPSFYNDYMNPDPSNTGYDNQKAELIIKGFTSSLLASFDLPVITVYGGVGFSTTSTNIKLTGDYPVPNGYPITSLTKITNPIDMKINSSSGAKPRLTCGVKFKMAVITYHIDYTYTKYSVLSTGLGISFR
jgi:hypothetical protein